MQPLTIELEQNQSAYRPGDVVAGTAHWHLQDDPQKVECRLIWYTQGKGDQDAGLGEVLVFEQPGPVDHRVFRFTLPNGPYSFSGTLISLTWAVELTVSPGDLCERKEITVAPTGHEILLKALPEEKLNLPFGFKVNESVV
jgi:hypothetical protein